VFFWEDEVIIFNIRQNVIFLKLLPIDNYIVTYLYDNKACYGSWNAVAYARLFRIISRNLKLERKGKGKGKPELYYPNGGAISGAGGVGW